MVSVHRSFTHAREAVFLFDRDGTLVDSVCQHVLAWREAFDSEAMSLSVWRTNRRIGMSGGLFTHFGEVGGWRRGGVIAVCRS